MKIHAIAVTFMIAILSIAPAARAVLVGPGGKAVINYANPPIGPEAFARVKTFMGTPAGAELIKSNPAMRLVLDGSPASLRALEPLGIYLPAGPLDAEAFSKAYKSAARVTANLLENNYAWRAAKTVETSPNSLDEETKVLELYAFYGAEIGARAQVLAARLRNAATAGKARELAEALDKEGVPSEEAAGVKAGEVDPKSQARQSSALRPSASTADGVEKTKDQVPGDSHVANPVGHPLAVGDVVVFKDGYYGADSPAVKFMEAGPVVVTRILRLEDQGDDGAPWVRNKFIDKVGSVISNDSPVPGGSVDYRVTVRNARGETLILDERPFKVVQERRPLDAAPVDPKPTGAAPGGILAAFGVLAQAATLLTFSSILGFVIGMVEAVFASAIFSTGVFAAVSFAGAALGAAAFLLWMFFPKRFSNVPRAMFSTVFGSFVLAAAVAAFVGLLMIFGIPVNGAAATTIIGAAGLTGGLAGAIIGFFSTSAE